ncbi:hypothetical protein SAE02_47190 [Skermanella aerolata]|uniref:Terminase small subunit n=1 Tax=Skermanella aerolata TaxID=393310 RepID=A0A512DVS2_9PROT|nr:terminase small subunit [Skermanella aerolata]GEO40571.1 hypothetical protein SAE02_47190 [Skermanella aerolata]
MTASPSPSIRLTPRQEAFCDAMACGVGGAEAARRAGFSAQGAKQRGAFLMRQPEIRTRIDRLRAARRAEHQALLDEAAEQVEAIIAGAQENNRGGLALRAIEFRLKLRGVIQDKRIAHHYHLDRTHPDADLEDLDGDPLEELDALEPPPAAMALPATTPAGQVTDLRIVTNSDLSRSLPKRPAPASRFSVPASAVIAAIAASAAPSPTARSAGC